MTEEAVHLFEIRPVNPKAKANQSTTKRRKTELYATINC